jgi:hypothetical protein
MPALFAVLVSWYDESSDRLNFFPASGSPTNL